GDLRRPRPEHRPGDHQVRGAGRQVGPVGGQRVRERQAQAAREVAMSLALLGQYVMNGVMLGMMYALVAVGFTLFFGVLDIIQFSHGDVLAFGAFVALAVWALLVKLGVASPAVQLVPVLVFSALATAADGVVVSRFVVLPLKGAPSLNVLLVPLMMRPVLREATRPFYPSGSQPQRFPALLPTTGYDLGGFNLRLDNLLLLAAG